MSITLILSLTIIGVKIGYTYTPGNALVRYRLARSFSESMGFHLCLHALAQESLAWPGCDLCLILLNTLSHPDVSSSIDVVVRDRIAECVMKRLLSLPDDILKRENTDLLGSLVMVLGRIVPYSNTMKRGDGERDFLSFWFDFTVKCVQSASLVTRLFGWEQLNELIDEAKSMKPPAKEYEVVGAGTWFVNGTYTISPLPPNVSCHM